MLCKLCFRNQRGCPERAAAEEPVTTRIRRAATGAFPKSEVGPDSPDPPATTVSETFGGAMHDHTAGHRATFREHVSRDRQRAERPLGVFRGACAVPQVGRER